jgi:hypothetical protein
MLFKTIQFHERPRVNNALHVLIGLVIIFAFHFIPNKIDGLPILPFEWAGIVLAAFIIGQLALVSTILYQIILVTYWVTWGHLPIDQFQLILGLYLGEWLAAWAIGSIAQQWSESLKPWWTFLIAFLGLVIIQSSTALWMTALPINDAIPFWKAMFPGVLILSSFILMITQIAMRGLVGRKKFYSKS